MSSNLKTRPPQHPLPTEIPDAPLTAALPLSTELLPKPAKGIYNSLYQPLRLGQRLGTGGEGSVSEIEGRPELAAKIYHEPPSAEKAEKLVALSRLSNEQLSKFSAWPLDVLRDYPDGEIIGFVMKRFAQAEEVHALHSPKSRLQKFPEASWAFLLYVATNIARATATIHKHGFVIGDLNPKNILVTRQATVHLLDCDSFQITADGKQYRCEGGFPEYTPPELQGVAFRETERLPQHDSFGLAIIIFQLLFMGRHPFSGRYQGNEEMPLERAIREFRFAYGDDAHLRQMQQPPGTLALGTLPASLMELFRRAFLNQDRPQAHEWIAPLESLAKSLKKCDLHSGHTFYQELTQCPWCDIETQARIRLFNFLTPGEKRTSFRLDEIWDQINRIEPPEASHLTLNQVLPSVAPSEEVAVLQKRMKLVMTIVYIFAIKTGVTLSLLTDGWTAFKWLFWILFFLSVAFNKLIGKLLATDGFSVDYFQTLKEQATSRFEKLSEQWNAQASETRFIEQFNKLLEQKDAYQELPATRQQRLRRLETAARETQLQEYLDKFEIRTADIKGFGSTTKTFLLSYNVETAADISEQHLRTIKGVGDARAEKLLEWRRELEKKFIFNPRTGIPQQSRIRVEQELDDLRQLLERELSNGAIYLQKTQREILASRATLTPELTQARESLAQAEKDWEIITTKKSPKKAIILLVISFFITSLLANTWGTSYDARENQIVHVPEEKPASGKPALDPLAAGAVTVTDSASPSPVSAKAQKLYLKGARLSRAKKFNQAVKILEQAIREDSAHIAAHTELGYALYRLGRYDDAIEATVQAPSFQINFAAQYNLGLIYLAREKFKSAEEALVTAVVNIDTTKWEESYTAAYDLLAKTQVQLNQHSILISQLEERVKQFPDLQMDRLYLGALYLRSGLPGARTQYEALRANGSPLAGEMLKLIYQHEGKKIPRKN
jgi:DNA-binding helix-hairpin-helix protein with protein kinase domain